MNFDPHDPYPLLEEGAYTYEEAKEHAAAVDRWLGLRASDVEAELEERPQKPNEQLWAGLAMQTLQTPYLEIRTLLAMLDPKPGQTVVDLGAAYGRIGLVLGAHYPEVKFLGYELVAGRVYEARRLLGGRKCDQALMIETDLARRDFRPQPAEFYFLYDFGQRDAIEKILGDLRGLAAEGRAVTVVGRGRASRDAIERRHPWLSGVAAPAHFTNYSIYRSR
jgi:hypothetical protein